VSLLDVTFKLADFDVALVLEGGAKVTSRLQLSPASSENGKVLLHGFVPAIPSENMDASAPLKPMAVTLSAEAAATSLLSTNV